MRDPRVRWAHGSASRRGHDIPVPFWRQLDALRSPSRSSKLAHRGDVAVELVAAGSDGARLDQGGQLGGGAVDAAAQGVAATGGAPVLAGGEHGGGYDDGVQVAEQRTQRVLEHQGVTGRASGRADEDRGPVEGAVLEDVEERLEQAGVGAAEHRRHGDHGVGAGDRLDGLRQLGVGEAGEQRVGDRVRERAQLDDLDVGAAQGGRGRRAEQVGEQPGRGRLGEPGRDDRDPVLGLAAGQVQVAHAAASSVCLRSSATTSPSRSSWCSTVVSGRPAWSTRNSWRW